MLRTIKNIYRSDSEGIVVILNDEIISSSELNDFFGLAPNTDLYINGILLESKNYIISSNGITKIEIIEPDNLFFNEPVINITIK